MVGIIQVVTQPEKIQKDEDNIWLKSVQILAKDF